MYSSHISNNKDPPKFIQAQAFRNRKGNTKKAKRAIIKIQL